ncbi:MAG TPA: hypothetical protein VGP07_06365 [Polyangia bacterium]|jgi:hypothetical protein
MADKSFEVNPYAPPKADLQGAGGYLVAGGAAPTPPTAAQLGDALARLKQYVALPANLASDTRAAGGLLRPVTLAFLALTVVSLLGAAATTMVPAGGKHLSLVLCGVAGGLFGLLGAALVAVDLSIGKRATPAPPEQALKRYLKAFGMGRSGYAWAALCPTAREQTVVAPKLGDLPTGEGRFQMSSPAGVKAYARTFARPGQKQMRTLRAKKITVRSVDGDLALVDADLVFQTWPSWVTAMIGICAAVFRIGLIVAVILFFVKRKRLAVTVTKTLLQGEPGVWYLFDANMLEGHAPTPR